MIIFRKTRETGSSCPLDKELNNSFLFSLVLSFHCRACFEDWQVYRSVKCLAQNGRPSESKLNYAVQPWTVSLLVRLHFSLWRTKKVIENLYYKNNS